MQYALRTQNSIFKGKEMKEIKESYQKICNMRCVHKIQYLNTLSIGFKTEEKEEICVDFLISLGINDLKTFP